MRERSSVQGWDRRQAPDRGVGAAALRVYFLAAALVAVWWWLLRSPLSTRSGAAVWLAACAAAGLLGALTATELAVRRVIVPLDGVAVGLSRSASNADRLKSTFVANMSHEIRTPLNSVLALSQLLRDGVAGPLTAEQRRYLEIITRNGQTLLRLIDDILDLSRIESGTSSWTPRTSIWCRTIAAVVEALSPLAMAKDLDVTIKLPEDLPRGPLRRRSRPPDLDQSDRERDQVHRQRARSG